MGLTAGYQTARLQRKERGESEANRFASPSFAVSSSPSGLLQRDEDPNVPVANQTAPPGTAPMTGPDSAQPLTDFKDGGGVTTLQDPPKSVIVPYHGENLQEIAAALPAESGSVEFDFSIATNGDPATNVTLNVTQTLTMPSWAERDKQCPAVQQSWDNFVAALLAHENGHVAINRKEFASAHRRFLGKPTDKIDAESTALQKHVRDIQEAYDTSTDHGRKGTPPTLLDMGATCPKKAEVTDSGAPAPTTEAPTTMQAKLTVNQPGDPFEQEADRIADRVVAMSATAPAFGRTSTVVQRALLQRCACRHKDEEEERKVQRKEESAGGLQEAPAGVDRVLGSGGGQPLNVETRAFMEPRFGHDFRQVRIHSDAQAADSARAVSARAYTVGQNVVFGAGQFSPATTEGKRLLAHELTHVVQQGAASASLAAPQVNRAITREAEEAAPHVDHSLETPQVMRLFDRPSPADQKAGLLREIDADKPDIGPMKDLDADVYRSIPEEKRLKAIRILLDQWWVGPRDRGPIFIFWDSFGNDDQLSKVASANIDLWNKSLEKGVDLHKMWQVDTIYKRFQTDVTARANHYLDDNEKYALAEMNKLGLKRGEAPPNTVTEDQTKLLQEMKTAGEQMNRAQQAQAMMKTLPVGYKAGSGFVDPSALPTDTFQVAFFDPMGPPPLRTSPWRFAADDPLVSYELVKPYYDKAQAVIEGITTKYPSLYSVAANDKLDSMAHENDPNVQRNIIDKGLQDLLQNIDKTRGTLKDGEFYLKLSPLHQQLFRADVYWQDGLHKSIGQQIMKDHESDEFWKAIGIGTLTAALFIVAELATAGSATMWLALGGGLLLGGAQAAKSWDEYITMAAAAKTNLSASTALVSQGQADSALVTAVLDTVFVFVDAYGAAGKALSTEERAAKLAAAAKTEEKAAQPALEAAERKTAEEMHDAARPHVEFEDASQTTHTLKILSDGRIVRCSECMHFVDSFLERMEELNGMKALDGDAKGKVGSMIDRAKGLQQEGLEIRSLPEGERAARETDLLNRAKTLEQEFNTAAQPALNSLQTTLTNLAARFPILGKIGLDSEAILRVIGKKDPMHRKGQLLEELLGRRVGELLGEDPAKLGLKVTEGLEFIPGHRITDMAGLQVTDGIIAVRQGSVLHIVMIFESKAGRASARGLRSLSKELSEHQFEELLNTVVGQLRKRNPELVGMPVEQIVDKYPQELYDIMTMEYKMSERGGQIRKDLERLSPGLSLADDNEVLAQIQIDGQATEVMVSPSTTQFRGVVPKDVRAGRMVTDITGEGFRFDVMKMDVTSKNLAEICDELDKLRVGTP